MSWKKNKTSINGLAYDSIAPLVISASRATDIPAFYAAPFFKALNRGYSIWSNPFNGKKAVIDFRNLRFIVFWTKNPSNILPMLDQLREKEINFYFNYTLNDYENENLEINLPPLEERVGQFINLSEKYGRERVIWRFDPLVLLQGQTDEILIEKIGNIAQKIHLYTNKLVVSFVETKYRKVKIKLKQSDFNLKNFSIEDKLRVLEKLNQALAPYQLPVYTCAESEKIPPGLALPNKCIDDDLIIKLSPEHGELVNEIQMLKKANKLKHKGQRKFCQCMVSKDIGAYNTCFFDCAYCYAGNARFIPGQTKVALDNTIFGGF
jgi:DNA repair photolyase